MALFSLQNNDDINEIIIITLHLPLHLVPGSVQSPSHMVTFFKSRYDFASCVNAVSIFKKRFRKLSDLLSWGAELVPLKAEHSKSLRDVRSGVPGGLHTRPRLRSLNVIGSFRECKGLPVMGHHAVEDTTELTVGCSGQLSAVLPVRVPGLTLLIAVTL